MVNIKSLFHLREKIENLRYYYNQTFGIWNMSRNDANFKLVLSEREGVGMGFMPSTLHAYIYYNLFSTS